MPECGKKQCGVLLPTQFCNQFKTEEKRAIIRAFRSVSNLVEHRSPNCGHSSRRHIAWTAYSYISTHGSVLPNLEHENGFSERESFILECHVSFLFVEH